jgi:hypothetical protein
MRRSIFGLSFCAALLLLCTAGGPARAGSFGSFLDGGRGERFWGKGGGRGGLELEALLERPDFPAIFASERALGDHPHQVPGSVPEGDPLGGSPHPWTDRDLGGCHDHWQWLCGDEKSFDALRLAHREKITAFIDGLRLVVASHHGGTSAVPEPGTAGMLLLGLVALARGARRRG